MPMREDIFYDSCGQGKIHACIWTGGSEPKAIVQIVHGIGEHVLRYDDFANYLTGCGYAVVAEDHMGHGTSSAPDNVRGYFHGGWFSAVKDSMKLKEIAQERFGSIPYFLFGHSMGSFMARTVLADYPDCGLAGCIICGTGWQSPALLAAGIPTSKLVCKLKGENKPSKFLHGMAFGAYNDRVEHKRTPSDWLSRDDKMVDKYEADPLCGFVPCAGLMRDMMMGIHYIQQKDTLAKMNKSVPCFFIAGGDDPVGAYGAGVRQTVEAFKEAGMERVSTKIYPLCRHEILNEINREEVYEDVKEWLDHLI